MKFLLIIFLISFAYPNYNPELEDMKLAIRLGARIDSLARMHDMTVEVTKYNYDKDNNILSQIKELLIYFAGIYTMVHGGAKGSKKIMEKLTSRGNKND